MRETKAETTAVQVVRPVYRAWWVDAMVASRGSKPWAEETVGFERRDRKRVRMVRRVGAGVLAMVPWLGLYSVQCR